jgi:RNA recognition motif-containing protein
MRGRRPLGYGFVSFETPEEAEKAAKELDKKDFNGRDVNVEIAKPRTAVNGATKPRPHQKRRTRRGTKEVQYINRINYRCSRSCIPKLCFLSRSTIYLI